MAVKVQELLEAANGEIVGKVRLQKTVYLLDQLGMGSGFSYEYHHYGPYSAELARTIDDWVFFDEIEETVKRRADGVPYSVFSLPGDHRRQQPEMLGNLPFERAGDALELMQVQDATVLELASTIHWLTTVEHVDDWQKELVRRKGVKTKGGRVEKATQLLAALGLPVA
jgi:uncharacterized protein